MNSGLLNPQYRLHFSGSRFSGVSSSRQEEQRLEEHRRILASHGEKGLPYRLSDVEALPSTVRNEVVQAANDISPESLERHFGQNRIGIAEEASDCIYFLGLHAAAASRILDTSFLDRVSQKTASFWEPGTVNGYHQLRQTVQKSLSNGQLGAFMKYLPGVSRQTAQNFLALIVSDYLVVKERSGVNILDLGHIDRKLKEEAAELSAFFSGDFITRQKPFLKSPRDYQTLNQAIIERTTQALRVPDFTLENAIQYQCLKSGGRSEVQFSQPEKPYDVMKGEAKAWEKLLEAGTFLKTLG